MQRIEIQNFGPIKDVAFDIKDYTVFIGPQASGKSTIAKLFYFFRVFNFEFVKLLSPPLGLSIDKITDETRLAVDQLTVSTVLQRTLTCETFCKYWHKVFLNQDFNIKYEYQSGTYIELTSSNKTLAANYSTNIIQLFEDSKKQLMNIRKQGKLKPEYYGGPEILSYCNNLHEMSNELFGSWVMKYIPAGRHIFPLLKDQPVFIADVLIRNFSPEINYIRAEWERIQGNESPRSEKYHEVQKLTQSILKGSYSINEDDEGIIPTGFHEIIPLTFASSGQQESLWVLLSTLNAFFSNEKYSYIIEEPEAHLFPESQENMMRALTYFVNSLGNQLMLTTHSPYILTPLNNLLYAHTLGQDETKREQVAKIIDPDLWLDPNRFECYYVDKGEITSVVDRDVNMINLEKLDSASMIGNDEYDKLSELEG